MAKKNDTEIVEFVALAGGYGLTPDGAWVILPADPDTYKLVDLKA